MGRPVLSIIIPVYNTKDYIKRCLDSIIAQEMECWEAIVVNDGSTDGVERILDQYASKDSRIKVFHIANGGVSNARNFGIEHAIGKYIGFIDSDDWAEPKMYSTLLELIESENYDMAEISYSLVYDNSKEEKQLRQKVYQSSQDIIKGIILNDMPNAIWNKVFKSDIIKENDKIRFVSGIANGEDTLFLFMYAKAISKSITSSICLYNYYMRENSAVHKQWNGKVSDLIRVSEIMSEELKDNSTLYNYCLRMYVSICVQQMKLALKNNASESVIMDLRSKILKKKKKVFLSSEIPFKNKVGVFLLWICPYLFYKMICKGH